MSDEPYKPTFKPPFDESKESPTGGDGVKLDPAMGSRFKLLLLTWGIALVAAFPGPQGIVLLPYFPLGLMKVLDVKPNDGTGGAVWGWLVYFCLCAAVLTVSRKFWYYALYALLVGLLLTNVAGCHAGWAEISKIN